MDKTICHIVALLIDMGYSEPFIVVNYEKLEYNRQTGNVRVEGLVVDGTGGAGTQFNVEFPIYFLRNSPTDEEIIAWRDSE